MNAENQTAGFSNNDTSAGFSPIFTPNSVISGDGFYISHNNTDVNIYDGETTALVLGQMEKFYLLKGDHTKEYAALIDQGFDACWKYFQANLDLVHRYSDDLPD